VSTAEEDIASIGAATLAEVRQFHHDFFGASAGDFTLVGDFYSTAVKTAVVRHFGDWRLAQPFQRIVRTANPTDSATLVFETPDKANAFLVAGHNVRLRDDDQDYAALALANWMLGGGFLNSRLATRIRQKEGISYGVGSGVTVSSLDSAGTFMVQAIYAPENAGRLVAAMHEELQKVLTEGFTAEEVAAAKSGYLQQRQQGRANDSELMTLLTNRRYAGRTLQYDERLDARLQALTVSDINAAVRKYIDPSKLVIARAGDFAKTAVKP